MNDAERNEKPLETPSVGPGEPQDLFAGLLGHDEWSIKPHKRIDVDLVGKKNIPTRGCFVIKSPMGTGKTELIGHVRDRMRRRLGREPRILVLSHRVALAQNLADRLGITNYNTASQSELLQADALTITPNSLRRLQHAGHRIMPYDAVVLEESEQQLAHIVGKTLDGPKGVSVHSILQYLIKNAEYVLALDAHAGRLTYGFLKKLRPETKFIENTFRPTKRVMKLYSDIEQIRHQIDMMVSVADKPVVVACDRRATVDELYNFFRRKCDPGKVRHIYRDNSRHVDTKTFVANINHELEELKMLIYSPSLGTGVDIQVEVQAVFGIFMGSILTHEEMLQMLGRCRRVEETHVFLNRSKRPELCIDAKRLFTQKYHKALRTHELCFVADDGRLEITAAQRNYLQLWSKATAKRNNSLNNVASLFQTLAQDTYTLESVPLNGIYLPLFDEDDLTPQSDTERKKRLLQAQPVDRATFDKIARTTGVLARARRRAIGMENRAFLRYGTDATAIARLRQWQGDYPPDALHWTPSTSNHDDRARRGANSTVDLAE